MSAQSWLDAHYPKPADQTTKEEALAHSLRKWEGLRPTVLAQHEVEMEDSIGLDLLDADGNTVIEVHSGSCALCHHHIKTRVTPAAHSQDGPAFCETCPLSIARGGVACDEERVDEEYSPWQLWVDEGNPEPMITWLKTAQQYEKLKAEGATNIVASVQPMDGSVQLRWDDTSHARDAGGVEDAKPIDWSAWDSLIHGGTPAPGNEPAQQPVSLSASRQAKPPLGGLTCESSARPSITHPDEE